MNRRIGTLLPGIISSLVWAVIVSGMYSADLFSGVRLFLLDRLFVIREDLGKSPLPHPDVMIVGVDEQTCNFMRQKLGNDPDNRHVIRTILLRLLEKLDRVRAGTVAIDFLLDHSIEKLDEDIVRILSREKNSLNVVLGCHRTVHEQKFPVETLQEWAAIGNVLLVADRDGRYRRFGYMEDQGGSDDRGRTTLEERVILPFAVQACRVHTGKADEYGSRLDSPFRIVTQRGAFVSIELDGGISIPMEPLIDFTGPARTFQRRGQKLSAMDIIGPKRDDQKLGELLGGKLVIIGPDFRYADRFAISIPVPEDSGEYRKIAEKYRNEIDGSRLQGRDVQLDFSDAMSGLEIHANIASQILSNRFFREARRRSPGPSAVIFLLPILLLGWIFWHAWIGADRKTTFIWIGTQVVLYVAMFAGAAGLIVWLFISDRLVFIPVEFFIGWTGQAATGLVFTTLQLRRHNRRVEGMFGNAVGHDLLEHIKQNPEILSTNRLGAGTVLFADIRGFTPLTEKLGGEEIINILGEYFEEMWVPLAENGAWVDKYVGDLVMAAWNILQPMKDHAIRAVHAAVGMKVALAGLNKRRAEKGLDPLNNGIGIHTGDLVCGNVGSRSRSNFTIIGDTVNLASRIESEARGGEILISEATYELVKDQVEARNWGTVPIKGKSGEYTIYEVTGLVDGPSVTDD